MIIKEMNEDIQNNTTDKGWSAMQAILDREMPVEQKKRRFAWWWFAILLLPMVAYGGWQFWGATSTPEQPALEQPELQLRHSSPMVKHEETNHTTDSVVHASSQETQLATDHVVMPNRPVQQPYISANTVSNHTDTPAPIPVPTLEPVHPIVITPFESAENTSVVENETTSGDPLKIALKSTLNFLPTLNHLIDYQPTVVKIPQITISNDLASASIRPQKRSQKWALGASAIIATEQFNAINNIGGGLVIDWQPVGRWGLRSGLLYNQYNASSSQQLAASVLSSDYQMAVDSGYIITDGLGNVIIPSTPNVALDNSVIIPVTKLKMLDLPLLVSWQVIRPIKLLAGINTAYVLSAKSSSSSYSGGFTLKTNSLENSQNLNSLLISELPRWSFSLQTGAGFKLGRNIELGLFARFPIQSQKAARNKIENTTGYGSFDVSEQKVLKRQTTPSFSMTATYFIQ